MIFICVFMSLLAGCSAVNTETYNSSIKKLKASTAGDIVYFGHYEQDNNEANGAEDIEWFVLWADDKQMALMSIKGLDCYEHKINDYKWQECGLRKWLNNDFLNVAFTEEEQKALSCWEDIAAAKDDKVYIMRSYWVDDLIEQLPLWDATEYARARRSLEFNIDAKGMWFWVLDLEDQKMPLDYGHAADYADDWDVAGQCPFVIPVILIDLES